MSSWQQSEMFQAERRLYSGTVALHYCVVRGQEAFVAQNPQLMPYKEGDFAVPLLEISNNAAQMLLNELWNLGFRPASGVGSQGQLAATETHLADMRAIAFSKLEVPKP